MVYSAVIWCLLLVGLLHANATTTKSSNPKRSYIDDVFDGYKRIARPVKVPTTVNVINITVYVLALNRVDEKDQVLSQNLYLDVTWVDEHLIWNASDYGNLDHVVVTQEKVWLPDFYITPFFGPMQGLGYDQLPLRLESSGRILWQPSGVFTTHCDVDITYYPLDRQVCDVRLAVWASRKEEVVLHVHGVSGVDYSKNSEWQLLSVVAKEHDLMSNDALYNHVVLTYTLKRRSIFFAMTVLLPTVLLALTSTMVFALPVQSGEKMSLCVTVFLALVLSLSILLTELPHSSLQPSLHVTYLGVLSASSAFAILFTLLVLNLHHRHRNNTDRPAVVGTWWARFAKGVRVYREEKVWNSLRCLVSSPKQNEVTDLKLQGPGEKKDPEVAGHRFSAAFEEKDREASSLTTSEGSCMTQNLNVEKGESNMKQVSDLTWEHVAECLDFVLFRGFMCLFVFGTATGIGTVVGQYVDDSEEW